jgi:hypothetical protein
MFAKAELPPPMVGLFDMMRVGRRESGDKNILSRLSVLHAARWGLAVSNVLVTLRTSLVVADQLLTCPRMVKG